MEKATKTMIDNIIRDLLILKASLEEPDESVPGKPEKVEMLTIKECTEVINGLSEHTVRQLVAQGKVKSVRTGEGRRGKILVNKADLMNYFER